MSSEKSVNSADKEDLPVDVSNQKLSKLPNWIFNSHGLSMLNAKNNKLNRLGKKIFKMTRLTHLNLRNNNLKKITRSRVGIEKLTSLRYLDLGQNMLSRLPAVISHCALLDSLSLDHNYLTELPREIITGLTKLQILHLDYNNIGPTLFSATKSRDSFEQEDESSDDSNEEPTSNGANLILSGETPFDISACWSSTLRHLSVSFNRLTVCPDGLVRLASLTYLDLSHNQLRELPEDIGNLQLLQTLIASSNSIEVLPSTLHKLNNSLQTLHLDDNRLNFIPPQVYQLTKLSELKLNKNLIGEIGHNVSQLSALKVLHLNDNRVRYIPFEITTLPVAQSALVDVTTGIPLTDINQHDIHSILSMSEETLTHSNEASFAVHLEGNPLDDQIPREVVKLGNAAIISFVRSINQSKAKWRRVKLMFVGEENVGKTTLLRILTSKFSSDSATANSTLSPNSEPALNSTTSVLNLMGSSSAPNMQMSTSSEVPVPRELNKKMTTRDLNTSDKNKATDGIKIQDWLPEMDEEITGTLSQEQLEDLAKYPLVYSCWDFAGQDVYYPTHQFFLSGRCITLLMFNLTDVKGSRIEYWLKAIKQRAGVGVGAPACLLIGTHRDDKRVADERVWTDTLAKLKQKYQSKFPFIKGYFAISCKSLKGIKELKKKVLDLTLSSRVMSQQDVPLGWVMLVDHIKRKRLQEQIINLAQFAQFARSCAGVEVPDVPTLIRFYNSVGILSFFDDTSDDAQFLKFISINNQRPSKANTLLNELVILNPQWIADLMSTIITIKHSFAKDGVLLESDLPQIWRDYPASMYDALLNLLEKFEVAYRLRNSNLIISPAITFLAKLPIRYERIKRKTRPGRSNTVFAFNYQADSSSVDTSSDSILEENVGGGRERSGTVIVHDTLPPFDVNAPLASPVLNDITATLLKSPRSESPSSRESKDDATVDKKKVKGSSAVTRSDRSKSFDLGKKNMISPINLTNVPKPVEKPEISPKREKEKEKEKEKRKSPKRKRDSDLAPKGRPSLAKSDNVIQSLSAEKLSSSPIGQPVPLPMGGSLDSVMDTPLPNQVANLKSSAEGLDDSIDSSVDSDLSSDDEKDPAVVSPVKRKKDKVKREKKKDKSRKAKLVRHSSGKIKISSTVNYSPEVRDPEAKGIAIKGVLKRSASRSNYDTPVGSPSTTTTTTNVSFDVKSSPESMSSASSERASSPRGERGRDSSGIKIVVPCLLPKEPNLKLFDALWPEPFSEFTSDTELNYDELSGNLVVSIDGNDQGNSQDFLHPMGRVILFEFMPLGFMSRLIVRTLQLRQIKPLYFWRHGIMLDLIAEDTSYTSRGLIVFDETNYNLHIRIRTKKNKEGVDERGHIKPAASLMMLLIDNVNILLSHSWFKFSKQPEIRIPCSHCLETKFDKLWTDPNATPSVMNICWFTLEECLMRIYTGSDHLVCSVTRQSDRVANLFSNNNRMRKLYNNYALNSGLRLVHDARRRFEPTLKTNVPLSDVCPDLTFSFLNAGENNISSLLVNFDDFVLERKLAVGGFAEIFVGKQKRKEDEYSSEEKIFAIKVLLNQMKQVTLPPSPRRSSATQQDQPAPANISMPATPRGSEAVVSEVSATLSPLPEEVILRNPEMSQQQLLQLQNLEQAKQSFAPKEVVGTEADELMDRESFSLLSETFRELQHEVFVMCHLRHPNIVTLQAISINPVALFMEFYPLGSLDNYLRAPIDGRSALSSSPRNAEKPKTLSWRYRVKVALDIAQGMNYLHGEDIIHRDLRSPNVLITDLNDGAEVVAKVTDFGMAQYLAGSLYGGDFNECWTAPEIQEGLEYNNKCDVYSFGIIMWELLQIGYPFMEFNDKYGSVPRSEFARAVTNGLRPTIPTIVSDQYTSVVAQCWQTDPDLRPSFNEIVEMLSPLLDVCDKWPELRSH